MCVASGGIDWHTLAALLWPDVALRCCRGPGCWSGHLRRGPFPATAPASSVSAMFNWLCPLLVGVGCVALRSVVRRMGWIVGLLVASLGPVGGMLVEPAWRTLVRPVVGAVEWALVAVGSAILYSTVLCSSCTPDSV